MGERLLCKQEVIGSIPFTSTDLTRKMRLEGVGVCDRISDPMAFGEDRFSRVFRIGRGWLRCGRVSGGC